MTDASLWPLVAYFFSVLALVLVILGLSSIVGEKSNLDKNSQLATREPFESGIIHIGSAQIAVNVEFYLIALFFVIFDLETVFIFAWAVAFNELALFGYVAISIFVFVLIIALVYEWKTGALDWGVKQRPTLSKYSPASASSHYHAQYLGQLEPIVEARSDSDSKEIT